MEDVTADDDSKRDFVIQTTKIVGIAGCAVAAWPFIASLYPPAETRQKGITEVDLSGITPGETKVVSWRGKPVFVTHRTAEQVEIAQQNNGGRDPEDDKQRVINPQWLVVVGVCTHLGCVPKRREEGWLCPCHGSAYDGSGRVIRGPAPRNLEVPPYEFVDEAKIRIG